MSFDISASSTGWAFYNNRAKTKFRYGLIKTSPKQSRVERLVSFKKEVEKLLKRFNPTHVVIEDLYSGLNAKTLILLAKFVGVAETCCKEVLDVEPYIISTNTVKAYLKAQSKELVFEIVSDIFGYKGEFNYKKHNDITDALAQLLCYYDCVLNNCRFRVEKDYGYLYEVI